MLLANVERERNGNEVERSLLKSTTAMLVELRTSFFGARDPVFDAAVLTASRRPDACVRATRSPGQLDHVRARL